MIKKLACNTFKNTGDINSYLEFAQIENTEKMMQNNISYNEEKKKPNLGENIRNRYKIGEVMGTVKLKGIVIAENNMGDFDKMLTLLTPNGKISCSAKGARRPKSQLMAGSQFLCFGDYMFFKTVSTYTLNSCETIEVFYNIRTDLDKLKYAALITRIIRRCNR